MRKVDFNKLGIDRNLYPLERTKIFRLSEKLVYKCFSDEYLKCLVKGNVDIEGKIMNVDYSKVHPNIIHPLCGVYRNNKFCGYIMPYIYGYDDDKRPYLNFKQFCDLYLKLEDIIKYSENMVFPDLLTNGNIRYTENNDIMLIDLDGIQIDDYITQDISSGIGLDVSFYETSKYMNGEKYTKNLDKWNLFIYFFEDFLYTFFNRNLDVICKYIINNEVDSLMFIKSLRNEIEGNTAFLEDICCFFDVNQKNIYIGDIVRNIRNNFTVEYHGYYQKTLKMR